MRDMTLPGYLAGAAVAASRAGRPLAAAGADLAAALCKGWDGDHTCQASGKIQVEIYQLHAEAANCSMDAAIIIGLDCCTQGLCRAT